MADETTDVDAGEMTLVAERVSAMAYASLITTVYTSSDLFFAAAPLQYQPYYFRVVRKCQQFYDGFVPGFHGTNNGIFSSRIAAALCSGLAQKVVGGNVGFRAAAGSNDYETVSWVSHRWAKKVHFSTFSRQAVEYANAFGTSMIKLNRDSMGNFFPQACRMDDFTYSEDGSGNVQDAKTLIVAFASTDKGDAGQPADGKTYFLVEHRFFVGGVSQAYWYSASGQRYAFPVDERVPMVCYEVCAVPVSYGYQQHILNSYTPASWESLPAEIKKSINERYGWIIVNKPMRLPFAAGCLGAWVMKCGGYDGTAPNMPFGKSLLRDIFTELAEYDIYETFKNVDVHNGKGVVFTPKSQDMSDLAPATAVDVAGRQITVPPVAATGPFQQRADSVQTLPGDPDTMKPFANQFDLRADQWVTLKNDCLRSMATKLHMSPKVISASLALVEGMGQKTATEIDSDDDSTIEWVTTQREIYSEPLNDMLECLLSSMGKVGNVEVKFGDVALKDKAKATETVVKQLQAHLISQADAIRELNPELDEEQIQAKIAACQAEKSADDMQKSAFPDVAGEFK